MRRWKTILSWFCFSLSAVLVVLGVLFTVSLVREKGEAAGAVNLAVQVAFLWVPPALVCAFAGYLWRRSAKKDSGTAS